MMKPFIFQFVHKEDLGKIVWNNVCVKMAHTVIHEMENVHAKLVLLDSFATEVSNWRKRLHL